MFDNHIGEIAQSPGLKRRSGAVMPKVPAFVPAPTKAVPVPVATLDGTVIDAGQFTHR